ncbi:hypothetical protein Tco_0257048 [Tanacetum coccineum]
MDSMNTRLKSKKLDGNIVQSMEVSNDDTAVAQRRLEGKQLEDKTNTDCLVKKRKRLYSHWVEDQMGNVLGFLVIRGLYNMYEGWGRQNIWVLPGFNSRIGLVK